MSLGLILALWGAAALAQPARILIIGEAPRTWQSGGQGLDPVLILDPYAGTTDTTNTPGEAIDFAHAPGWIGPLFFAEDQNIARRVLLPGGSVSAPNAGVGFDKQLEGTVNGDHEVAFERKPTIFEPRVLVRGLEVILAFAPPVGVHRVRFYPRNTVVPSPGAPFQSDFMRGYELWLNAAETGPDNPDALVARSLDNQEPVVDLELSPQYARYLRLKSIAEVPFEIDEIEVYGTGYLSRATYVSDLLDLGDRATLGPLSWAERAVGEAGHSAMAMRVRTGSDPTPIVYLKNVYALENNQKVKVGEEEVGRQEYYALERVDRAPLKEDVLHWSPWVAAAQGSLINAPNPRRYVQVRAEFGGELYDTRQLGRVEFPYLQPPIADGLVAEVYPRLARAEEPATFRYAVRLSAQGQIRGYDKLEVDTNAPVLQVREARLNGEPFAVQVEEARAEGFVLRFPLIQEDGALLEFTFDLPIFRFGTTFSGRAYHRGSGEVPQALEPGDAALFGPGDSPELSGLSVEIPRPQIGKLVGQIIPDSPLFTPNGDGANDEFALDFNLLQLTRPTPVRLEIYDLGGRRVHGFAQERGIGPARYTWDGRTSGGGLAPPGIYLWVLRVQADAFEERHQGILGVVY
jgi:hypothetical protein